MLSKLSKEQVRFSGLLCNFFSLIPVFDFPPNFNKRGRTLKYFFKHGTPCARRTAEKNTFAISEYEAVRSDTGGVEWSRW